MVPQITKTGKPGKSLIEVFFPAFPQDKCLCVVNYLKSYERKTTKYRNVTKETQALLFISFIRPDAPVSSAVITRWLKAVLARAGMDTASFQGHSVRSAASSSTKKLGVSSAEIMKVADWSRESTFIKFYPKTPLNVLLLEGRFYHQPNPVVICILIRLTGWCPVLHEEEFRIVQRLGTNLQYSTNSAIFRMGTSPPVPTHFITAILLLPVLIFLLSLSFFPTL